MPHKRESRYIGAGMHAIVDRAIPRTLVERRHQRNDRINLALFQHLRLFRRGQYAYAERLCEEENVPLFRAKIFIESIWMPPVMIAPAS